MNGLVLCLCLSFGVGGDPPRDRWFAEDKYKHFAAAFAATTLSASAARTAGVERDVSVRIGVGAGGAISVWKEIRDHRTPGGRFSVPDLMWDAAGIAASAAMLRQGR